MKKQARCFLFCWLLAGLTACNLPARADPGISAQEIMQQYQTVSALLTQTAQVPLISAPTSTNPPKITRVVVKNPSPVVKATQLPAAPALRVTVASTRVAAMAISQSTPVPCDLAQPGRPIDVTVPDESRFHPGEYFSKTWRLVNAGSCPWGQNYAVVWFSGDDLGVNHDQAFVANVMPGKSLDVTVDMLAPEQPGTYQSNWKLRSSTGDMFGIGPNGDAPFWVRIVVVPEDTPTVNPEEFTPQPSATATPVALSDGSLLTVTGLDHQKGRLNLDYLTWSVP